MPPARTIYVAGAIGNATTITAHQIHALSVDDGAERAGWPVDVSTITGRAAPRSSASPQNQRSALSLVGGILYVAYGGHNGDCGNYRGWVVAVDTANPTKRGAWATGGTRGEAIWAAGRHGLRRQRRLRGHGQQPRRRGDPRRQRGGRAHHRPRRPSIAARTQASSTRRAGRPWTAATPTSARAARCTSRRRPRRDGGGGRPRTATLYLLDATNLGGMGAAARQTSRWRRAAAMIDPHRARRLHDRAGDARRASRPTAARCARRAAATARW